jgi:Carboxypeptidase regulatory-like domain
VVSNMKTSWHRLTEVIVLLLLTIALSPLYLMAQVAGGSISGTVTDPTGAVVPNAEVKILHRITGITHTETTTGNGYYSSLNLSAGEYDITVSTLGFETMTVKAIKLGVGAELKIDLKLVS